MKYESDEYRTICEKLGFNAAMRYVRITKFGKVEPTARGTRNEALALWCAAKREGLVPTRRFEQIARRENF